MTVLEAIQRSAEFLERKDVDSPRLQAELLLAHLLAVPRLRLYLDFDRPLTDELTAQLRELVKRRGQREPLQHLVGSTSFCGLEIVVNRDVLIPRPETELLAELAWTHLKSLAGANPAVLDFGTGSGCLAIAVAVKCPSARVTAVDLSTAALAVARQNATRHGVADRIAFVEGDGAEVLRRGSGFDLVVANPPYIPAGDLAGLQPEVRDHDPRLALVGGADGLDVIRSLAAAAPIGLRAGGRLMMEFGDGQAAAVGGLFASPGWCEQAVHKDLAGTQRILVATKSCP